jgi:hypothetical protein
MIASEGIVLGNYSAGTYPFILASQNQGMLVCAPEYYMKFSTTLKLT